MIKFGPVAAGHLALEVHGPQAAVVIAVARPQIAVQETNRDLTMTN